MVVWAGSLVDLLVISVHLSCVRLGGILTLRISSDLVVPARVGGGRPSACHELLAGVLSSGGILVDRGLESWCGAWFWSGDGGVSGESGMTDVDLLDGLVWSVEGVIVDVVEGLAAGIE